MNCQKCSALVSDKATLCAKCSGIHVAALVKSPHVEPSVAAKAGAIATQVIIRVVAAEAMFMGILIALFFLGLPELFGKNNTVSTVGCISVYLTTVLFRKRILGGLKDRFRDSPWKARTAAGVSALIWKGTPMTVTDLIDRIFTKGAHGTIDGALGEPIGLAKDAPSRNLGTTGSMAGDNMLHCAMVITEKGGDPKATKPVALVFETRCHTPEVFEYWWYRVSLAGELVKAARIAGTTDERGWLIKDVRSIRIEDVASPGILKGFRHELDLWLRLGRLF